MEEDSFWLFVVMIVIVIWIVFRVVDYKKNKQIIIVEREQIIQQTIPGYIQQSMNDFTSGIYEGEEQSPLAYVGYKAGKTKNMQQAERRERLAVCFRLDIPRYLPEKYHNWGSPATALRFVKMQSHLNMLAQQRNKRKGYETAVLHWREDREWFINELNDTAKRFKRYGF